MKRNDDRLKKIEELLKKYKKPEVMNKVEESESHPILNSIGDFIALALSFYILIGFFSLIAIARGEDIPYMPFWHKPWEYLLQLFLKH